MGPLVEEENSTSFTSAERHSVKHHHEGKNITLAGPDI